MIRNSSNIQKALFDCRSVTALREESRRIVEAVILEKFGGQFSLARLLERIHKFRETAETHGIDLSSLPDNDLYNTVIRSLGDCQGVP